MLINIWCVVKNLQLDWFRWWWCLHTPKRAGVEYSMSFSIYSLVHKFWLINYDIRLYVSILENLCFDSVLLVTGRKKWLHTNLIYPREHKLPVSFSQLQLNLAVSQLPFHVLLLQCHPSLTSKSDCRRRRKHWPNGTSLLHLLWTWPRDLGIQRLSVLLLFWYEVIRLKFNNLRLRLSANQLDNQWSHTRIHKPSR